MRNLRYVEQSALVHEIHKHPIRHDRPHHSFIYITHLWNVRDGHHPGFGSLERFFVSACDIDDAFITSFFNIDDSSGGSLDVLDHLTTRANDGTDLALLDDDLQDAWCMRLEISSWGRNDRIHLVEDMQSSVTRLE